jgi:hypothetical protein
MSNLKIKINSNATTQMERVIAKLETIPNRIASAQESALRMTANELNENMKKASPASKYFTYSIHQSGALGMKLEISIPEKGAGHPYWAAIIFLKGRRGGKIVTAKGGGMMKVREESRSKGYPDVLRSMRLSTLPAHEQVFKNQIREMALKNIQIALKRRGVGPMGGFSGTGDLPSVRSSVRLR